MAVFGRDGDLGIRTWQTGSPDRAALTWLRGRVVKQRPNDPRTALLDLRVAHDHLPGWLSASAASRIVECEMAEGNSRKRVPSVKPRPSTSGQPRRSIWSRRRSRR